LNEISQGRRQQDIAKQCGTSVYTISRHYTSALDELSIAQVADFVNKCSNNRMLISPKSNTYVRIVNATNFAHEKAPILERIWYINNDTKTPPVCTTCGVNHVKWSCDSRTFRSYCCSKCQGVSPEVADKKKATNIANRGVEFPTQSEDVRRKYNTTMNERYGCDWANQQHISEESRTCINNPDMLKTLYNTHKNTFIVGDLLGVSQGLISMKMAEHGIPAIHNTTTSVGQQEMISFITDNYTGSVITNDRTVLDGRELDILLPDINVAFEYNGVWWHSELAGKNKNYHLNKHNDCAKLGVTLTQIHDCDWLYNNTVVKSRILNTIGGCRHHVMARKCIIEEVSSKQAKEFFDNTHTQGGIYSKVAYGLWHDGELVQVMSFGIPRFTNGCEWELLRLSSKLNHSVVGGASKLFKYFIKTHKPSTVVSYNNNAWGSGSIYNTLGFTFSHSSSPNYKYFHKNDTTSLLSRQKFQKHKLSKLLEVFDPTKTEWENMKDNGWNRIWDCGNDVYVWSS
jgi:hypothetical protein